MVSNVAVENILLFLDDGRELRSDTLRDIRQRHIEGNDDAVSYCSTSEFYLLSHWVISHAVTQLAKTLYLYNRETFWTEPERWVEELKEDIYLPPTIECMSHCSTNFSEGAEEATVYSGHADLSAIQQPFLIAHDHLLHLQSLYLAQTRAVEIAYTNLFHHLQPLLRDFSAFALRAENDLEEEARLIRGSKVDMVLLSKIRIHEGFLAGSRKRDRNDSMGAAIGGGDGSGQGQVDKSEMRTKKTLGDYVSPRKMEEVRKSCRNSHGELGVVTPFQRQALFQLVVNFISYEILKW